MSGQGNGEEPGRTPAARLARPDERDAMAEVLADAFDDDPVMRFIVPNDARYRDRLTRLFRIELGEMLRLETTWVVDDGGMAGVAVWAPPDRWKQSPWAVARTAIPALRVFGRHIRPAVGVLNAVEGAHPETPPHWYLGTLGTASDHQGRGVGGLLLRAVLDRCDTDGVAAYLESSKPANVPYYERFGFTPRGELALPGGGPTIVPMWREPAPPS
jgi:GNAT superfamily N-acetyltransferase